MQTSFAKAHPEIVQSLNKLAGKITEEDMQQMNYQVNVEKEEPKTVAHNYLVQHHLIEEK